MLSSWPPMRCGIGDYASELAPYLVRAGVELDVVTYDEGAGETPQMPGVRIARTLRRADPPWRVARALREASPGADVVLVQSQTFLHPRAFNLFPRFWKGPPIVAQVHDAPLTPRLLHASIFLRTLYRASSRLVTMSGVTEDALLEQHGVPPERVVRTPLGVDLARHRPGRSVGARARLGWDEAEVVVLFLGFLNRGKGVFELLEGFARAAAARPALRLVFAGEDASAAGVGGTRAQLQTRAEELGVEERVSFEGFVPRERMASLLANADVVALPYAFSYQSAVLSRAMASGAPILASRIEGFTQWVVDGESALLVPPRDAPAIAAALARLADDAPLRARLGDAAAQLAAKEHGFERTAANIARVLREAVELGAER
ncbi:MAG TPA: glycosyltransferase family 4 protein [Candidatus Thermoplasmatota archaeon]|nr:glycosyltransferase family 4 protein [Candidatus Thermoplasmatota archaeon]